MNSTTQPYTTVDEPDARQRLWELIKDIRFSMFTARHSHGHLHSRPMTTQNTSVDDDSSLWFFISRGNEVLADIARDPAVNITYADVGSDSYVSVSGNAAVVENLTKKRALWTKMAEAWFPAGPADEDLALVQVKISHADYWDVKDSKLVQLFKMAKASITGAPPTGMGEHREVHMR